MEKTRNIPIKLQDRLAGIWPQDAFTEIFENAFREKPLSVRINTTKIIPSELFKKLDEHNIRYEGLPWSTDALVLSGLDKREFTSTEFIQNGFLYIQALSSMLPVCVLDPQPGERILDMCSAPGSKTTQMAALTKNAGDIVAVDNVRKRIYKLKSVIELNQAKVSQVILRDARKLNFSDGQLFDRVLLDAPCSSEGRIRFGNKKSSAYWSVRKVKEMAKKQRGLLLAALRYLKVGGTLVYSTCTFAPEENEAAIDWLLRKADGAVAVEPVRIRAVESLPCLTRWNAAQYDERVSHCLRVRPNSNMEGFFIAKLKKLA